MIQKTELELMQCVIRFNFRPDLKKTIQEAHKEL